MKMKIMSLILFVFISTFCSFAQNSKLLINDVEVRLKFVEAANVKAGNVALLGVNLKERWLQISVRYTPAKVAARGSGTNQWLDDFSIQYDVIIPSMYKGKDIYALLSGRVTYWSVELDGDQNNAVAFISPKVLRRYTRPGIKLRGKRGLKDFRVRVTFYNKQNRPIGRGYAESKGSVRKVSRDFKIAEESLGVLKVPDTVFGKNDTPWADINYDAYELIKINRK